MLLDLLIFHLIVLYLQYKNASNQWHNNKIRKVRQKPRFYVKTLIRKNHEQRKRFHCEYEKITKYRGIENKPYWPSPYATTTNPFFSQIYLFTKFTTQALGSNISPKPNSGHKSTIRIIQKSIEFLMLIQLIKKDREVVCFHHLYRGESMAVGGGPKLCNG